MSALRVPTIPDDCECPCKLRATRAAHSPRCFRATAFARTRIPKRSDTRSTTNKSSSRTYNRTVEVAHAYRIWFRHPAETNVSDVSTDYRDSRRLFSDFGLPLSNL